MKDLIQVTFLGTNGSCSYNNGLRNRIGTNTPCVVITADDKTFVFDAGSGICGLNGFGGNRFSLFLSHYHVDHLNGLLFCRKLFDAQNEIDIYGFNNPQNMLGNFISMPFSPIGIDEFKAKINYITVKCGDTIQISEKTAVRVMGLSHPGGSVGYRFEHCGKRICYFTDVELYNHNNDLKLEEFAYGADLLIADSSFADNNIIRGWGHSSAEECARFAKNVNAERLALFHYDCNMSDDEIENLERSAKEIFAASIASYDGLKMEI